MSGLQFTKEHVQLIRRGVKTQTRRRAKGDEVPRWRRGRSYAVQPGRGKPAVCRVKIVDTVECDPCKGTGRTLAGECERCAVTVNGARRSIGALKGVRLELLGELTYADAVREGYRSRADYQDTWMRLHDRKWLEPIEELLAALDQSTEQLLADDVISSWSERTLVRRLRWLERAGAVRLDKETGVWERQSNAEGIAADARFEQRWANIAVWVITFEIDGYEPRFLAAEPPDSEKGRGDYVTSPSQAMFAEKEAVSESEQKWITDQARDKHIDWQENEKEQRDAERAHQAFEHRLRTCRARARTSGVDVERRLYMVEKLIAERRSPESILNKLQGVERLLDEQKAAA